MNQTTVQQIWERGEECPGFDPAMWRRDVFGFAMRRDLYGERRGRGWLIAHKHPKKKVSSAKMEDLLPFRWEIIDPAETE